MNENKIAFIMCVNSNREYMESVRYINMLIKPENIEIEIIKLEDAKSMCQGYNKGMNMSDAKYKVYMHQDVFIVNKNFIQDVLNIFQDESIGMIGMVGSAEEPPEGIMWYGDRCGGLYGCSISTSGEFVSDKKMESNYEEVYAIDGLMMITNVDIEWKDNIFDGWDFYDISHSRDMINIGKKVVVPRQANHWCIHDDGLMKLDKYFKYREIFENEYMR